MFLLIVAIAVWGVVHSYLASLPAKDFLRRAFGEMTARAYRLVYNAFSVITFVPILLLVRTLPDHTLYVVPVPWLYVILASQAVAVVCLIAAVIQTDAFALIGLRQLIAGQESSTLVTHGFYHYVRHPMYLFGLLVIWLMPVMTLNTLVLYVALTVYVLLGAWFEERKLLAVFGAAYAQYRARTPMLLPFRPFTRMKAAVRR